MNVGKFIFITDLREFNAVNSGITTERKSINMTWIAIISLSLLLTKIGAETLVSLLLNK